MNERLQFGVTLLATLGCGLIAGVFFAFSAFVMPALARLEPQHGIAAMRAINVAAVGPAFMAALFGTAAACLALAGGSLFAWHRPGAGYLLAGGLIYLLGVIVVTIAFNVPRNDALAAMASPGPDDARAWAAYVSGWTAWNHVRALAAALAAALFALTL